MEEVRECVGGGATSSLPAGGRVEKTISTPLCGKGVNQHIGRTRRTRIHTAHTAHTHTAHTHTHGARTKSHIIVIAY